MSDMTKTRSVLDLVADGAKAESFDGLAVDDYVWFEQPHDEGDSLIRSRRVVVDRDTFEELGSPTQITITIEPGDLLNPVGQPCPICGHSGSLENHLAHMAAQERTAVPVEEPPR